MERRKNRRKEKTVDNSKKQIWYNGGMNDRILKKEIKKQRQRIWKEMPVQVAAHERVYKALAKVIKKILNEPHKRHSIE